MNKDEMWKEHREEFEARWKLAQIDRQLDALQKERQKAHEAWVKAKDKTRTLKKFEVVPFEDSPDFSD